MFWYVLPKHTTKIKYYPNVLYYVNSNLRIMIISILVSYNYYLSNYEIPLFNEYKQRKELKSLDFYLQIKITTFYGC